MTSEQDRRSALERQLTDLFVAVRMPLLAFFTVRLGTRERAEEACQDVFLRFTQAGYEPEDPNAKALIFSIARNHFNDHLRRLRREREAGFVRDAAPGSLDQVETSAVPPDEALISRQTLLAVSKVLTNMPEKARRAFLMHRVQRMKYREIAEVMGVSVSRVEKLVARALIDIVKAKKAVRGEAEL